MPMALASPVMRTRISVPATPTKTLRDPRNGARGVKIKMRRRRMISAEDLALPTSAALGVPRSLK